MARLLTSAALLALGLSAGACGPVTNGLSPHYNPSISSVNQPVVQRTDYVLDVTSTAKGVPASEQDRLSDWFASLQLGYGDSVSVDEPAGYANARSRTDVAKVAASYGLLLNEAVPVTAGAVQPGSVRVVVSRTAASVPGCPQWNGEEVGARLRTMPNYGCATNSNLAAMIADPSDLVLGRSGNDAGDASTATKAIKTYRDKQPTGQGGLKIESTGGK